MQENVNKTEAGNVKSIYKCSRINSVGYCICLFIKQSGESGDLLTSS